jgi:hypothetical protein
LHAGAAKAEQGAHQGGQGQLAAAGEGVGVVGAAGQLGKARAVQVVTQVGQKILCKFTVLRQNSCQPQKKIKQNQGLTDYSSLSSVDWIIDYRLYDPERDGKSKLDHVREMLTRALSEKALPTSTVLMDTWYATKDMMVFIDALKLTFICPIKANRLVDDSAGKRPYRLPEDLDWQAHDILHGKTVKIHKFPNDFKVKLFRVANSHRTDWIVTNDLSHDSSQGVQDACALRWKIEQFHRELKQVTGVEKCQARTGRIQRNHIVCAVLVWVRLTKLAREAATTIYQLKRDLLSNYLRNELRSPSLSMRSA